MQSFGCQYVKKLSHFEILRLCVIRKQQRLPTPRYPTPPPPVTHTQSLTQSLWLVEEDCGRLEPVKDWSAVPHQSVELEKPI